MRTWRAGRSDELGIEVISFIDEEGRFAGLLGSAAFTGRVDESDIGKLKDERGEKLESALAGGRLRRARAVALRAGAPRSLPRGAHRTGPRTGDRRQEQIGLVTDIVGVARCEVVFTGQADHAGTTPMELRRDAAAALYAFADDFARFCSEEGSDRTVWNLGIVAMDPGAYNVVTRQARLGVEYRDPSDSVIDRIRQYIGESAGRLAKRHRVSPEVVDGREHPSEPYGRILAAPHGAGRRRPGRIQHANAERRRTRRHDAGATDSLRDDVRAEHRRPQPRHLGRYARGRHRAWD